MDRLFQNRRSKEVMKAIRDRTKGMANGVRYSGAAFEEDLHRFLNALFPFSVLRSVRLFDPQGDGHSEFGCEMDALLHLRQAGEEWIVVIEAKHQPIEVERGRWLADYPDRERKKCSKDQIDSHIRTLWSYLEPVAGDKELRFMGIVVTSEVGAARQTADGYRNADLRLVGVTELPRLLEQTFVRKDDRNEAVDADVLRVAQSEYLDLLRLSNPMPELGHPEYTSALRYVERCRRLLDDTLFREFDPTPERWAINGSAGMGKSVLIAYAAAVLCTGYELLRATNKVFPMKATGTLEKIGMDPAKGTVIVMAMSEKQLANLRQWFLYFVRRFQDGDSSGEIRLRPPEFRRCEASGDLTPPSAGSWSALLVDEAHDLESWAQKELAQSYHENGFYLVVACDRHQKLRLTQAHAKIVEGLDFSRRTKRLRQIYRNPVSVYIASLALMFRWFASDGIKVIPTREELERQFGFQVLPVGKRRTLKIQSDSHPANGWAHTLSMFPDVSSAFSALLRERLTPEDVLWVRFSTEAQDFNYEKLARHFTYHNFRSEEADKLSDKYIKGQDFPVVVIEGFPRFMDRFETREEERKMWRFRRELYLCASRATCFLYLICNIPESEEISRVKREIEGLVSSLACPNADVKGTPSWSFELRLPDTARKELDVFADAVPDTAESAEGDAPGEEEGAQALPTDAPEPDSPSAAEETEEPETPEWYELHVYGEMSIDEFAVAMELRVEEVEDKLLSLGYVVQTGSILRISTMNRLAAAWNTTVTLMETDAQEGEAEESAAEDRGKAVEDTPASVPQMASANDSSADDPPAVPARIPASSEEIAKLGTVELPRPLVVRDVAQALGLKPFRIMKSLMQLDVLANPDSIVDESVAREICKREGFTLRIRE